MKISLIEELKDLLREIENEEEKCSGEDYDLLRKLKLSHDKISSLIDHLEKNSL